MKIAVDARPLIPPLTGIGRYTYELLQRLVQSEHEWYLYSNVPLKYDFLDRSNVTVYVMPFAGGWPGLSTIASQLVTLYGLSSIVLMFFGHLVIICLLCFLLIFLRC